MSPEPRFFAAISSFVTESRDHEAKRLDYAGISTFSAGLFLLIWALIDGNALGWTAPTIVERFAGAAVLLLAFLIVELVQTRPMVDFTLFAQPTFLGSVFAMLGYAAGGGMIPSCCPVSSITRISRTRMRSLVRTRSSRRGERSKAILPPLA